MELLLDDDLITAKEASAILNVTTSTVYKYRREGRLKAAKRKERGFTSPNVLFQRKAVIELRKEMPGTNQ